jgi:hypothetical protein
MPDEETSRTEEAVQHPDLVRALETALQIEAEQDALPSWHGADPTNVLVLQDLVQVTEEAVFDLFCNYGKIKHLVVTASLHTGMVVFENVDQATRAKEALGGLQIGLSEDFRIRYGLTQTRTDEELAKNLLVPPHKTNFLLSPPPSPPESWVPAEEHGPNCITSVDLPPPVVLATDGAKTKLMLLDKTPMTPLITLDECERSHAATLAAQAMDIAVTRERAHYVH